LRVIGGPVSAQRPTYPAPAGAWTLGGLVGWTRRLVVILNTSSESGSIFDMELEWLVGWL